MKKALFGTGWRGRRAGACLLAVLAALLAIPPAAGPAFAADPTDADLYVFPPNGSTFVGEWSRPIPYVVGNAGPATATGVTVTFEVPTGLTPYVGGLTSCTATDAGHLCTIDEGSRFPAQAPRSSIIVRGDAPGSYNIRFTVRGDQPDPDLSNNAATGTIVVLPAADVSVQVTGSADPSRPGRPVTYTVTVANHGPSPATEVTLTDMWQTTARGGVKLQSVRTSQGTCSPAAGAALQCRLGALAASSSASVTITLRPHGKGTLTDTASVTAAEFDPANTNNTDSETTTAGRATSP